MKYKKTINTGQAPGEWACRPITTEAALRPPPERVWRCMQMSSPRLAAYHCGYT